MEYESLQRRVERERKAHDVDDVLAKNQNIKARFSHYDSMPYLARRDTYVERVIAKFKGHRVLDYGCGKGENAVRFLRSGAFVFGIDISANYVKSATGLARRAGFAEDRNFKFQVMDAHSLAFDNDFFDFVMGNAILHHLDLKIAIREIKRVLKRHGRAIFEEPLGHNPLLRLYRWMTPNARTADEKPLHNDDLNWISSIFATKVQFYGLLSLPTALFTSVCLGPFPNNPLLTMADRIENSLNKVPVLRKFNQVVLIDMEKVI